MPTPTPMPQPPPIPLPVEKTARNRPFFNRAQLEDLAVAEAVAAASGREPYKTALAAREITDAFVLDLKGRIVAARDKAGDARGANVNRESKTLLVGGAERELIVALQEIQAAAKQKFFRANPGKLQDYLVGQRLNPNRATLVQNATTILDNAAVDALPGWTVPKQTAATAKLAALQSAGLAQGQQSATAVDLRVERDGMIREINDLRMTIQFAADAEYAYTEDGNHAARKEFYLPLSRPFTA